MTIIVSVFLRGYRGKTVDFSIVSQHHKTTVAYFLNHGKWDDSALQKALKSSIVELIYQEARSSGQPVFCIVDDTIASHVKNILGSDPLTIFLQNVDLLRTCALGVHYI